MKFKYVVLIFTILLAVNYPIASYIIENDLLSIETEELYIPEKVKIKTGSGDDKDDVLVIKYDKASGTTKLELSLDGVFATLRANRDEKHLDNLKYKETDDKEKSLIAEVKYGDSGFKLVDKDDKLLWKVKVTYDKIKISDNEDGNNPFQIKKNKKGKIKIYDRGQESANIGVIKQSSDKLKVKAVTQGEEKEDLYSTKDLPASKFAIGVLIFKQIPVRHRAIILTELLRKGK